MLAKLPLRAFAWLLTSRVTERVRRQNYADLVESPDDYLVGIRSQRNLAADHPRLDGHSALAGRRPLELEGPPPSNVRAEAQA